MPDPLPDRLRRLSHDGLVALVAELVSADPTVARRVSLLLDSASDDAATLADLVDGVLKNGRQFLDYRATLAYAVDAQPVAQALRRAAAGPAARDIVPVVERAVGHVVRVLLHADDSAGAAGDVARALLEAHALAAATGRPDPTKLVRWLTRFTFDTQDFFNPDVRDYRDALG